MSSCRRCQTEQTELTRAEDDVLRIARKMARTERAAALSSLGDQLAIAKANRTEAVRLMEESHECDTRLSDEHWTKRRA